MIGQPYNYGMPPNPIGNIMNLGNQGYMGNYYNPNSFQGYYNPYLVQQQMKQQEIIRQEQERKHRDVIKNTFRIVYKARGYNLTEEEIEERLKFYDPIQERTETPYMKAYGEFERFKHIEEFNQQNLNVPQNYIYRNDGIPDDISMYDFLKISGKLLQDEYYEDLRRKNRNVSNLYNRDQYSQLLGLGSNRNNNYFSSVFNNGNNNPVDIDDMEITLPSQINDEYHQRKRAFLDALMK